MLNQFGRKFNMFPMELAFVVYWQKSRLALLYPYRCKKTQFILIKIYTVQAIIYSLHCFLF